MKNIPSFEIDHTKLRPGLYISRRDRFPAINESFVRSCPSCKNNCGNGYVAITTFDLRFVAPNNGEELSSATMHTIEHLGATFLRNQEGWKDRVVYFGPMGCRTGFYLIMALSGQCPHYDVVFEGAEFPNAYTLVLGMLHYIVGYPEDEPIPGVSAKECGNWEDHDLEGAKKAADAFLNVICGNANPGYNAFSYP